jgi:Fe-Mn family superoxide dismutase
MFTLPTLPYQYDALAPYISEQIQHLHHTKHHQTYVDNLNKSIDLHPELHSTSVEELLTSLDTIPDDIRTIVRNHGGGHYNHSMFWEMMSPHGKNMALQPTLLDHIQSAFGDLKTFQDQFSTSATKIFGSGWQWLVLDGEKVTLMSTPNQDNPISQGKIPLLGLDVWEHAYYLQYYSKRTDYIEAWWNVVNWEDVARRLDAAIMRS